MKDDIRSLITSGPRAKVSPRDATLNNNAEKPKNEERSSSDRSSSGDLEPLTSLTEPSVEESPTINSEDTSSTDSVEKLEIELSQLPVNGKRLAIHLEKELRSELLTYCNDEEITPETFMEASLVILKQHPEIMIKIANEARSRLFQRKRAGFIRRTLSMLKGI